MPHLVSIQDLDLDHTADLLDPPLDRNTSVEHVSDLIDRLAGLTGRKQYGDEEPSDLGKRLMAMGRITETILRPTITEFAENKGWTAEFQCEAVVEGVIGSLDGKLFSEPGTVEAVVEMKSRSASPGDLMDVTNDTHWRYQCQTMAYCFMTGCQTAYMPILWFPRGAPDFQLKLYEIKYSIEDLLANWAALRNMRRVKVA